jgi:hypothetical protein
MSKGKYFFAVPCKLHGTLYSRNETIPWAKVRYSKHPRIRDGKTPCIICRRIEKNEAK